MPLVSKIAYFFLLFALSFANISVATHPEMAKSRILINRIDTGGGVIGIDEETCIVISNNPSSDGTFGISTVGEGNVITNIKIVDGNGNIVFLQSYNENTVSLDASGLTHGEYVITITTSTCARTCRMTMYQ